MPDEPYFEVASCKGLREKHALYAGKRPLIRLNPACVPEKFRQWVPLAERWGIGDDLIREDCVDKATQEELRELLSFGDAYDAVLKEWLVGPAADSPRPTAEYRAFTCLGMAWDSARVRVEKDSQGRTITT